MAHFLSPATAKGPSVAALPIAAATFDNDNWVFW